MFICVCYDHNFQLCIFISGLLSKLSTYYIKKDQLPQRKSLCYNNKTKIQHTTDRDTQYT